MRYLLIIFSLLSFVLNQNIDDLSEEQKQKYNRNKITIETSLNTVGSTGSNTIVATTTKRWSVYKGFDKISEEDFLRIAGYSDEANQAKKYTLKNKRITRIGGALFIISLGMIYYSESIEDDYDSDDYNSPSYKWGDAAAWPFLIGGSLLYGSLFFDPNRYTYGMVKDIADSYNRKLIQEIKNSE